MDGWIWVWIWIERDRDRGRVRDVDINKRRFVLRNWLVGLWDWDVPGSALCKLEMQESLSRDSESEGLRPKRTGDSPPVWGQKTKIPAQAVRQEESVHSFPLCLLFYLSPRQIGWCSPSLGEQFTGLSPRVKMLMSPGNTLTDASRRNT